MTAPSTQRRPRLRPAFLVLLAMTAAFASIALPLDPAGAEDAKVPPSAPVALGATGYEDGTIVYWSTPELEGKKPVELYRIQRFVGFIKTKTFTTNSAEALVDATATPGTKYRYRVQAISAHGSGPWSGWIDGVRTPGKTHLDAFGGDATAFVQRQFQDFAGRNPGIGELSSWTVGINNKSIAPEELIEHLVYDAERVDLRHPLIRLYLAYFDRAPDHGGLNYWINRRLDGKKLDVVSSNFAGSSEFQNTYGTLSNADFVTLVYQNVLKRDPEPGGHAYWTNKLDTNAAKRGRVMTQFSESNEHKNTSDGRVLVSDMDDAMLSAGPSAQTLELWGRHLHSGGTAGTYGLRVMELNAY